VFEGELMTEEDIDWRGAAVGDARVVSELGFDFSFILRNLGSLMAALSDPSVFELVADSSVATSVVGSLEPGAGDGREVTGVSAPDRGGPLLGETGRLPELNFGED
jgi:hypothetical protein